MTIPRPLVTAKKRLSRAIAWQYVRKKARQKDIDDAELIRIGDYLDSKFGLRQFETADPSQNVIGYFPGLSLTPIYEAQHFSWVKTLEESAAAIREEFLALQRNGVFEKHPQNLAETGDWSTYYLYSNGHRFTDHCETCPITTNVLENIPGATTAGQAYFSLMTGGTHVKAHSGPTNTRIRCHLGLIVPDSSRIRVNETKMNWKELGCIVFDDSVDHEVWNPDDNRAVLIVDLWHPDLTNTERWAIAEIANLSRRNSQYRTSIGRRG
jgi:aspartate beta-hydroxylase